MSRNRLRRKLLLISLLWALLPNFAGAQNTDHAAQGPDRAPAQSPGQPSVIHQDHPPAMAEAQGATEYNVWGGYSPMPLERIGVSQDRQLFMAGFGYARVLLAGERVAFKYIADVVPVALVSQPTFLGQEIARPSLVPAAWRIYLGRRTTYGMGTTPVGFQLNFRRGRRIQPFVNINGGLLYFTRQTPTPGSANFNFTFSTGTGVQIFKGESRGVTVGYRFHHISNANTGNPYNPGLDSNFFYAAYSFFR